MTRIDTTPQSPELTPAPGDLAPPVVAPARLGSIDAYRGLVMLLMMGEVLRTHRVAEALGHTPVWEFLSWHQSHAEWRGCSLHDLIQPSFSFLVGVALPFSLASRRSKGGSLASMTLHAAWRAFLLAALGIFLRSMGKPQTNFTFEDTLTQIGLGYLPLFLLGLSSVRVQIGALIAILFGYWLAFALYPLPGPTFDWQAVGVPADWPHHPSGFAAHWDKNSNPAWAFDTWFLNLFPREKPFLYNGGGYSTLSFIPTLGTMILGLLAGQWIRAPRLAGPKLGLLVAAGLSLLAAGWALDVTGLCPAVKRIWTPSWTLLSGGWCFLFLAGFYAVIDSAGLSAWSFPLRVIGRNSIAAYLLSWLAEGFVESNLHTHLGHAPFEILGPAYAPMLEGAAILTVFWLFLFWMDRRKIYLKI